MNRFRLIAIFFIIGIGLMGSYFILKNSGSLPEVKPTANNSDDDLLTRISPIKWVESPSLTQDTSPNNSSYVENPSSDSSKKRQNLTDLVAQSIFDKLKQNDQLENISLSQGIKANSPEGRMVIQQALANVSDGISLNFTISDNDIKINPDNSSQSKENYLTAVGESLNGYLAYPYINPGKVLENFVNTGDPSDVKKLAGVYSNLYDFIIGVSVPSRWRDLHKRFLTLLKKGETVYSAIADFQNDPVKAQLYFKSTVDLAKEDLDIKNEYMQKAQALSM